MHFHFLEHDDLDFIHSNITDWASRHGHTTSTTHLYQGEPGPDPNGYDWLIILGGTMFVWEEDQYAWLAGEKAYLRKVLDLNKPVLGICFGAQLLAEALGGEVFLNGCPEIGWRDVALTPEGKSSFLFKGVSDVFMTFHWHSSHFSLPDGCVRLAESPPTRNQAFICEGRKVVGIQFHPEFSTGMIKGYGRDCGHTWQEGPCCEGLDRIMDKTDRMPETYWLMAALMDNMVEWAGLE